VERGRLGRSAQKEERQTEGIDAKGKTCVYERQLKRSSFVSAIGEREIAPNQRLYSVLPALPR
jgi:hypothetical protein